MPVHACLRLVALGRAWLPLPAKTEKAKKNGLSSPFLVFAAVVIIAKNGPDLKGSGAVSTGCGPRLQPWPTDFLDACYAYGVRAPIFNASVGKEPQPGPSCLSLERRGVPG